jgi:hypothetical protein
MDPLDEIARKQSLLRKVAAEQAGGAPQVPRRGVSHVEGILARGDRRVADVIEAAWRDGARFDGWEEVFDLERWQRALAACGVDGQPLPRHHPGARALPWDHIDVGLEDGFLLSEYRRALKDRLSPPCGKPAGSLLHHTNLDRRAADERRLVCYDCGVACDMSRMREDRLVALAALGAVEPSPPRRRPPRWPAASDACRRRSSPGAGDALPAALRQARPRRLHLAPRHHAAAPARLPSGRHGPSRTLSASIPSRTCPTGRRWVSGWPRSASSSRCASTDSPTPGTLVERLNQVSPEGMRFLAARAPRRERAGAGQAGPRRRLPHRPLWVTRPISRPR